MSGAFSPGSSRENTAPPKTSTVDIEPFRHLRSGSERTCYSLMMQKHPMIYDWFKTGPFDASEGAYNKRCDALINGYPIPLLARQPGDLGYEEARPLLEAFATEIIDEATCQNWYDLSCREMRERGQDELRIQKREELRKKFPIQNTEKKPQIVLVASRCRQLNWHAFYGGQHASEPQWRDALSVGKFCIPDACVELSDKHPGFNESEMLSKLANIDAPFYCETFENHRPGGCTGCKFKGHIKSPIALGFEHPPKIGGKK